MRPHAPKQTPSTAIIATPISRTEGSIGVITAQPEGFVDLNKWAGEPLTAAEVTAGRIPVLFYHEGIFRLFAKTINGQGGTPTSPGVGKSYTFYFAFSNEQILNADAPTVLDAVKQSFSLNLPNTAATDKTGTVIAASDIFPIGGRYLYFWIDRTAFAANALVQLALNLSRL
jgi:hypothetical protein